MIKNIFRRIDFLLNFKTPLICAFIILRCSFVFLAVQIVLIVIWDIHEDQYIKL